MHQFNTIEDALKDFENGEFLIVMDNENRENEGDLTIAAQDITPEKMAFLIRYTSGYVCCPTTAERFDQLKIPMMVPNNTDLEQTASGVSLDYRFGTTTGISAADRALTCNALADPSVTDPADFIRPGHMLPLRARPNGILERQGHTEASVELCKLAGKFPTAIVSELCNDNGTMKRKADCFEFSMEHGIKIITIDHLIKHVRQKNSLI
ncbi:3,4-dihydroxy-2-butanone 4-phosphate synthase [Conidiobolus coronatus NRRL 28638]|uniref:3,4-dihydroxy-2-butanone 4-phosphate synthase n=1 Tax=Conidiobolus coronatus (strain ATCC 28846 / CBS 209.66 / NRRL 28638) TaxID=796925 RepID=A0A137P0G5_CONC2|nr:3,4-dihydroxy-2-butanone 4-phosphate synthase [Conidiobolus coronatus NRRL 28638]|eukprot:KXN68517.1 3,4-dihydroxy-2-butanone 4-phosphate synthase [Conidiobolus coronatus NRRL 28638]